MPTLIEKSNTLHQRVQRFASDGAGNFEDLALSIATFQAQYSEGYRRLLSTRGRPLDRYDNIVAVPSEVFRLTRVAVHDPSHDEVRLMTSGTTDTQRGTHYLRTTATYEHLALTLARRAMFGAHSGPWVIVALAPVPEPKHSSSLSMMMELFMRKFDGRPMSFNAGGRSFESRARSRWLLNRDGVDVSGLQRAARLALDRNEPLMVLSTSFALVYLLDALRGSRVQTPRRTLVMQTGGYKGRTRRVKPDVLRRRVARAFGISQEHVVAEYGMTELTSQLYEGCAGAELDGPPGSFVEPPWVRVTPVDPVSLDPCAPGEIGIARIIDLGNVDSAVCVQTQDLVRRTRTGIELFGRRPGQSPRGCSLAAENLVRHVGP